MNKKELIYFIAHFEKITKWMFKKLPRIADLSIDINEKQKITKLKYN